MRDERDNGDRQRNGAQRETRDGPPVRANVPRRRVERRVDEDGRDEKRERQLRKTRRKLRKSPKGMRARIGALLGRE